MPTLTSKKKPSRRDADSDSDETAATAIRDMDIGGAEEDDLNSYVDMLTEKRAASRKEGLENAILTLAQRDYEPEILDDCGETLLRNLLTLLRKGDTTEAEKAGRCLGLFWITIGTDSFDAYEDTFVSLHKISKARESGPTLGLILELMALSCFASSQDPSEVLRVMRLFEQHFNVYCDYEVDAALSSWGLLVTMLPTSVTAQNIGGWLRLLEPLLARSDLDVRSSAGECLALIFSAFYANVDDEDDYDEEAVKPVLPDTTGLLTKIRALISLSSKSVAKSDRARQRSQFRDIEGAIVSGKVPTEEIRLRGESVVLETWICLKQMGFLRTFLQDGLQSHLESNEFVRSCFGLGEPLDYSQPKEKRSSIQKKITQLAGAAQGKERSQRLAKQRSQRETRNASFFADE